MGKTDNVSKHSSNNVFKSSLFFVLAIAVTWLLWMTSLLNTWLENFPQPLLIFGQFATWGPLIAALILLIRYNGRSGVKRLFKSAWNWKFNTKWLAIIILLPFVFTLLSALLAGLINNQPFTLGVAPAMLPMVAIGIFFTGGPLEEFGWRGYALPELLKRFNGLTASLIVGAVHALWHLPLHFIEGTVQSSMPFWEFALVTAIGSIIYTWIFIGTGYSLTASILHHWVGNIACALIPYWQTQLGRWLFLAFQLAFIVIIVAKNSNYMLKNEKNVTNDLYEEKKMI